MSATPRAAIAHEWLVNYAGSERVVEQLLAMYPTARMLTSVSSVPPPSFVAGRNLETSFLQYLPGSRTRYQYYLPLMPLGWRLRRPVEDVDVVISSSHACAHAVRTAPWIPHVSYCHTPMRYAWDFESEQSRFPRGSRAPARAAMRFFRRWDADTAQRVTTYVANSSAVAQRVLECYGRRARVIHPPVDTNFFSLGDGTSHQDGQVGDPAGEPYFLYVGRLVSYKRADLVVEAFRTLPYKLLVVGHGHLKDALVSRATPNISFLDNVDRRTLRRLYRYSTALVYPAVEDFGITMAEAQACGSPVIGVARGGATDIVIEGLNGWFAEEGDLDSVRKLVHVAAKEDLPRHAVASSAQRFNRGRFESEMEACVTATVEGALR